VASIASIAAANTRLPVEKRLPCHPRITHLRFPRPSRTAPCAMRVTYVACVACHIPYMT
jgi:hypothetical protein